MPAINLQQGLEALYTFDSIDTDGQRNRLLDRSGHGRHGDLQGGVTTGVSSPVGEAYSFDGSDDVVTAGSTTIDETGTFSVGVFFKAPSDGKGDLVGLGNRNQGGWFLRSDTVNSKIFLETTTVQNGGFQSAETTAVGERWQAVTAVYDGGQFSVRNHTENATGTEGIGDITSASVDLLVGKANGSSSEIYEGEIAHVALWGRPISGTEREHYSRMTDRMVSYL